jgi:hypothetical protein
MENKTLSEALRGLIGSGAGRSKMGRLRDLLPEIEAAQYNGVNVKTIIKTMSEYGLEITEKSFPTMLHRARKGLKKSQLPVPVMTMSDIKASPLAAQEQVVGQPVAPAASRVLKKKMTTEELRIFQQKPSDMNEFNDEE